MAALPDILQQAAEATDKPARRVVDYLLTWPALHCLGYGTTHAIALEAALKLKEITYTHCEGMFSSEFKHGPLAAVHDGYPVLFFTAPGDEAMMVNHINEVTTRGGYAIAVAADHPMLRPNVQDYLPVPAADPLLAPIVLTIPAQLIAYHLSVAKGIDPDFPRNLSKTVTVD